MDDKVVQNIDKGFLDVVNELKLPIKSYLLKRIGLSSHEVKVITKSDEHVFTGLNSKATDYLAADKIENFARDVVPNELLILNSSKTSPAIMYLDYLLDFSRILSSNPSIFAFNEDHYEKEKFAWRFNFLDSDKQTDREILKFPVLHKGSALRVCLDSKCQTSLAIKLLYEDRHNRSYYDKHGRYLHPREDEFETMSSLSEIAKGVDAWVAITLDNEDVLPFKWNHLEKRYEPGFKTVGLEVN